MSKPIHILLAALTISSAAAAQSFEHQVYASSGAYLERSDENLNFSLTLGEAVIFTGTSNQLAFTQGFQQPYGMPLATNISRFVSEHDLSTFPNPVNEQFQLNLSFPGTGVYSVFIRDMAGREVLRSEGLHHMGGNSNWIFNTGDLAAGVYTVTVSNRENTYQNTIRISKQFN